MMSLDCPLAIRYKKGEYIWMEIGGDFLFLFLFFCVFYFFFYFFFFWSFRALDCIKVLHPAFILLSFFYGLYMLGGDIIFYFYFLFHIVLHWLLIYIYKVIHDICLLFYVM